MRLGQHAKPVVPAIVYITSAVIKDGRLVDRGAGGFPAIARETGPRPDVGSRGRGYRRSLRGLHVDPPSTGESKPESVGLAPGSRRIVYVTRACRQLSQIIAAVR
jgi:hypothetical protein